jgi:penicillin amidase
MRKLRRRLIALSFVILSGALGAAFLYLRSSLPDYSGSIVVPGLDSRVTIARDANGVPTIKATSERAAYFALGYVHAQDRLWQMEQMRRLGAGRLSEIVGARALASDRFMRTLGLYRTAEANIAQLSEEARAALEAYSQGVNGFLATRTGALPPEFLLLGAAPESWRPADSLVFGRIMAMRLAGNWREELIRSKLAEILPQDRIDDLWAPPPAATRGPVSGARLGGLAEAMLAAIPETLQPLLASNAWAVDGGRTTTGKPILANDPHLAFDTPNIWYLARIEAPELVVAGATVAGVPYHLLGHNQHLAWGITTTHADTMDLFVERPVGQDHYETQDGPEAFASRTETIKVKDAPDEILTIRASRHGPIISDLLGEQAQGKVLALSATALRDDDRTGEAIYRMTKAKDWDSFREALRDFHSPPQNIMYAGQDGLIAMTVAGRVPKRKTGDGTLPMAGWDGTNGWSGLLPRDVMPQFVAPAEGFIVNANNRPVGEDYPHLLAANWPESYRADRITERLREDRAHTPESSLTLQQDVVSGEALHLLPLLLARLPRGDARTEETRDLLSRWDGRMMRNRPEPLIFSAWMIAFQSALVGETLLRLPAGLAGPRPYFIAKVLEGAAAWCYAPGTTEPDKCGAVAAKSLTKALADLEERHGARMAKWRWGDAHMVRFEHPIFLTIPGLAQILAAELETDGGDFTINRGSFDPRAERPFLDRHGPGMRAVYDLADLGKSRFIIAMGQSGNPFSRHWSDLATLWRDGGSFTLDGPIVDTLLLEPPS